MIKIGSNPSNMETGKLRLSDKSRAGKENEVKVHFTT